MQHLKERMATHTKPAYKPWKVEYAKSSRSSCRTCNRHIAKDAFRLARIQPAHQFDGLMPQWHHASCVFHHQGEITSLDDVDGLEDLRPADLQHLRKYIQGTLTASDREVDKGKSVAPIAAPGGSGDNSGEYEIENARSSRSVCKSCYGKIEKGQVRVATMVDNPRFRGNQPAWRHVKCFLDLGWWTSPMAAMAGWDNLSIKDQSEVHELAKASSGVKEGRFVETIERHEVGSKRKNHAAKGLSPKKSPRLSRIKEMITDVMRKDPNAAKKRAGRKDPVAVTKRPRRQDPIAVTKRPRRQDPIAATKRPARKDPNAVKKRSTRRSVYV